MVDAKTVGAALGAVVVAEASGVTNLSGGDGGDSTPPTLPPVRGGGGQQIIPVPSGGGGPNIPPELLATLASRGDGGTQDAISSALEQQRKSFQSAIKQIRQGASGAPTSIELNLPDGVTTDTDDSDGPPRDKMGTPKGGEASSPDDFKLQDLAGTGAAGTAVATIGESGVAAGSAGSDAMSFARDVGGGTRDLFDAVARSGRTARQGFDLLTTGSASGGVREDATFASTGPKRLDFSGDGTPGGKLTDRLPI